MAGHLHAFYPLDLHLCRVSSGIHARRRSVAVCHLWRAAGSLSAGADSRDAGSHLRRDVELYPIGGALLYFHGYHAGQIQTGGRLTGNGRSAVWPHPRWTGAGRGLSRHATRCRYRCDRSVGRRHGHYLVAGDVTLWLFTPPGHRRDCGLRHAGSNHSTQCGLNCPGRPDGCIGRRTLQRCADARLAAGLGICRLCVGDFLATPRASARFAAGRPPADSAPTVAGSGDTGIDSAAEPDSDCVG